MSAKLKAVYRDRPIPDKRTSQVAINAKGEELVNPEPHELILASPKPLSIREQVDNLTRLGEIRRLSMLDKLPDDYYAEDFEDDVDGVGITPHELEGAKDYWGSLPHSVPDDVSGREEPRPVGKDGGAAPNEVEPS